MSITIKKITSYTLPIIVDYSKSLYEMIGLTGVSWFNPDITPTRFVICGNAQKKLNFGILYNRNVPSEKAISDMNKLCYRPAKIEELLAFAAAYPHLKWNSSIIALGTTGMLNGSWRVAFLHQWKSKRDIRLIRIDEINSLRFRFAFIKTNQALV